ncbi:MAG: cysteine--1-D-myo-inosityl 2-amino-2-deoxy-alpha-D-glucopyranoside ligase [Streptosporangiales bacterium]
MDSWAAPDLPTLSGLGPSLNVHDAPSGELVRAAAGGTGRIYACGITPYDATHVGHAATYLAWDLVVRQWRDAGVEVRYVQNVTDIDDPLLERADRDGEDWRQLAEREIDVFRADMAALRVLPPDEFVGAVEALPEIVSLVDALKGRGAVYDLDGDLYFPVGADRDFGAVSRLSAATMVELSRERGGDPDRPGKQDPVDPLLWRAERPGEPSWASPFGPGRPGWHVECAAIALRYADAPLDLQAGGTDLAFPHHEMSASHARVATGRPFARAYLHAGMVGYDGAKMSKSLGNLVFISGLRRDGHDPMAIRLAMLAHHYRGDWDWTTPDLDRAAERLARWRAAVNRESGPNATPVLEMVRERMASDLDAPGALACVDSWAEAALAGTGDDADAPALVRSVADALLGVAL